MGFDLSAIQSCFLMSFEIAWVYVHIECYVDEEQYYQVCDLSTPIAT